VVTRVSAARREPASRARADQVRRQAGNEYSRPGASGILRQRLEQRVGMGAAAADEQGGGPGRLGDLPGVYDRHRSARPADHTEVVGDQDAAMSSCRRSPSISSRICFWIVTFSAVVAARLAATVFHPDRRRRARLATSAGVAGGTPPCPVAATRRWAL